MSRDPQRVAVAGATGYIGGRLAPRLIERGYKVRCLVRFPGKIAARDWARHPAVEVMESDLEDGERLARDLEGCDAAFYLVHSMTSAGSEYARRDLALALQFAAASRRANLSRIIYLGGLGETGADLSEHLASRREVEEALASAGVPVTVLRAAMIIGSGSASFEILRYLVERLPVMVTPKWVSTPCQPIAVDNVIEYLLGVLSRPETEGERFDIGGGGAECAPDTIRSRQERTRCVIRTRVWSRHSLRFRTLLCRPSVENAASCTLLEPVTHGAPSRHVAWLTCVAHLASPRMGFIARLTRKVVTLSTEEIVVEDFPDLLVETSSAETSGYPRIYDAVRNSKKQSILEALEQAKGSYVEAARILGLHPSNLHRLIRNLKMKGELQG